MPGDGSKKRKSAFTLNLPIDWGLLTEEYPKEVSKRRKRTLELVAHWTDKHTWAGFVGIPGSGDNDSGFEVRIHAPADATNEDIIQYVKGLSDHLDNLHVSFGGKGLSVEKVEVFGNARVPEGAGK